MEHHPAVFTWVKTAADVRVPTSLSELVTTAQASYERGRPETPEEGTKKSKLNEKTQVAIPPPKRKISSIRIKQPQQHSIKQQPSFSPEVEEVGESDTDDDDHVDDDESMEAEGDAEDNYVEEPLTYDEHDNNDDNDNGPTNDDWATNMDRQGEEPLPPPPTSKKTAIMRGRKRRVYYINNERETRSNKKARGPDGQIIPIQPH